MEWEIKGRKTLYFTLLKCLAVMTSEMTSASFGRYAKKVVYFYDFQKKTVLKKSIDWPMTPLTPFQIFLGRFLTLLISSVFGLQVEKQSNILFIEGEGSPKILSPFEIFSWNQNLIFLIKFWMSDDLMKKIIYG